MTTITELRALITQIKAREPGYGFAIIEVERFFRDHAEALISAAERVERLEAEKARKQDAITLLADAFELIGPHLKGVKVPSDFGEKLKALHKRADALKDTAP